MSAPRTPARRLPAALLSLGAVAFCGLHAAHLVGAVSAAHREDVADVAGPTGAANPANTAAEAPAHRVILISLDGAGSITLHELYRQGLLHAGGFDRFFRDGEVAAAMIPVEPTLTSVNHASLSSGFRPDATGIVGNTYHAAGTPFADKVNGFDVPIATETLWEAARRQGRRVGILTWPGADGKSERRSGDWGMVYNRRPEILPEILLVERSDWQPPLAPLAKPAAPAAPAAPPSGSPENSAITLSASVTLGGEKGQPRRDFAVQSLSRATADGSRLRDRITLAPLPHQAGDAVPRPLAPGDWQQVIWPDAGADGGLAAWLKFLRITPDLSDTTLVVGGAYRNSAYPAAFAAALVAAGLHWPGPPDTDSLQGGFQGAGYGIDLATWTEQAEHLTELMGKTLRLSAARSDWDLLMAYFSVLDDAGHPLQLTDPRQEGFSPQRRDELAGARLRVWQAIDRELARLLDSVDLRNTTVVVVSDHGMAPVHTAVNPNVPLVELGLLAAPPPTTPGDPAAAPGGPPTAPGSAATAPGAAAAPAAATTAPGTGAAAPGAGRVAPVAGPHLPAAYAVPDGGVAYVYLDTGGDATASARILADLARRYAAWRVAGEAPVERVFTRRQAAALGLDHPNSGDLILFARPGYAFRILPGVKPSAPPFLYGAHGYLSSHPEMLASYMAIGAGVKAVHGDSLRAAHGDNLKAAHAAAAGTLRITDVAPRVAGWLGIAPPSRTPRMAAGAAAHPAAP